MDPEVNNTSIRWERCAVEISTYFVSQWSNGFLRVTAGHKVMISADGGEAKKVSSGCASKEIPLNFRPSFAWFAGCIWLSCL
jgi:hypothetical protein